MAAPGTGDPLNAKNAKAPFAQRIDPTREKLTPAQLQFMQQVQLAQWQKTLPQRRTRNIVTGLGIGALVLAICIRLDKGRGTEACGRTEPSV